MVLYSFFCLFACQFKCTRVSIYLSFFCLFLCHSTLRLFVLLICYIYLLYFLSFFSLFVCQSKYTVFRIYLSFFCQFGFHSTYTVYVCLFMCYIYSLHILLSFFYLSVYLFPDNFLQEKKNCLLKPENQVMIFFRWSAT
jgi:hypothetical protein